MRKPRRNALLKDITFISIGILSATFGLKGFIVPNDFLDGGSMGLSLLAQHILEDINLDLNLGIYIVLFNLPFIIMGYKQISSYFAIKTLIAIVILAVCVDFIPIEVVTEKDFLAAIFGGIFLGAGIGFAVRGGCVIDGTEVLALYMSKRTPFLMGDIIMVINLMIFIFAIFIEDVEIAMFAMITYATASRVVNFIIHGIEEYAGILVLSDKNETIRRVFHKKKRPLTILNGEKGTTGLETKVIYIVATRLEVTDIVNDIRTIDPNAFVIQSKIDDAKGGVIKQRPLH